jgi:hypothetical protein
MPAAVAALTSVRTGAHDCYERVTFVFREDNAPQYAVRPAEPPFAGPSGEPIPVAGSSFLLVHFETAYARYPGVDGYDGPNSIVPPGFQAIREVRLIEDFEAVVNFVIGLDAERPFRVGTLTDPPRVYVDIFRPPS